MTGQRYLQICVEASDGVNGPGLKHLLERVLTALTADWVVLSDVDLIGRARASLLTQGHDVRILSVLNLFNFLDDSEQVIWATIFLCRSKEAAETITGSEHFVSALAKAEGLVRVVDAGYYYVYGPLANLEGLRSEIAGEQKEGFARELDFPE